MSAAVTTVRRQGDLMKVALLLRGTQRANLKLATFTTREVTALEGDNMDMATHLQAIYNTPTRLRSGDTKTSSG